MTRQSIPKEVNPSKLARDKVVMDIETPLREFDRLSEYAISDDSILHSVIEFGFNQSNEIVISGSVKVDLNVQCSRCLQDFILPVEGNFKLTVVKDDNLQMDDTEVVTVSSENAVYLREIVEDEVLLGLPIVTKHQEEDCVKSNNLEV